MIARPTIEFDDALGVATINGVKVTYDLIEAWTQSTLPGQWFRVVRRPDGVAWVERRFDPNLQ